MPMTINDTPPHATGSEERRLTTHSRQVGDLQAYYEMCKPSRSVCCEEAFAPQQGSAKFRSATANALEMSNWAKNRP